MKPHVPPQEPVRRILEVLHGTRFRFQNEDELQVGIAGALAQAGVPFEREVRLSAADRVDFLCGDVVIEVKIDGTCNALAQQIHRYAGATSVGAVVVVTNRSRLLAVPTSLRGKPVHVVSLLDGGLR